MGSESRPTSKAITGPAIRPAGHTVSGDVLPWPWVAGSPPVFPLQARVYLTRPCPMLAPLDTTEWGASPSENAPGPGSRTAARPSEITGNIVPRGRSVGTGAGRGTEPFLQCAGRFCQEASWSASGPCEQGQACRLGAEALKTQMETPKRFREVQPGVDSEPLRLLASGGLCHVLCPRPCAEITGT